MKKIIMSIIASLTAFTNVNAMHTKLEPKPNGGGDSNITYMKTDSNKNSKFKEKHPFAYKVLVGAGIYLSAKIVFDSINYFIARYSLKRFDDVKSKPIKDRVGAFKKAIKELYKDFVYSGKSFILWSVLDVLFLRSKVQVEHSSTSKLMLTKHGVCKNTAFLVEYWLNYLNIPNFVILRQREPHLYNVFYDGKNWVTVDVTEKEHKIDDYPPFDLNPELPDNITDKYGANFDRYDHALDYRDLYLVEPQKEAKFYTPQYLTRCVKFGPGLLNPDGTSNIDFKNGKKVKDIISIVDNFRNYKR